MLMPLQRGMLGCCAWQVDKQGSVIDSYVEKLDVLMLQKLRNTAELQDRLKAFKAKLVEEEIMSRSIGSRRQA